MEHGENVLKMPLSIHTSVSQCNIPVMKILLPYNKSSIMGCHNHKQELDENLILEGSKNKQTTMCHTYEHFLSYKVSLNRKKIPFGRIKEFKTSNFFRMFWV